MNHIYSVRKTLSGRKIESASLGRCQALPKTAQIWPDTAKNTKNISATSKVTK